MTTTTQHKDLDFTTYQKRQALYVSESQIRLDSQRIQCSNKFLYVNHRWVKNPYPGYAVVARLNHHENNAVLQSKLAALQLHIAALSSIPVFSLPPESYHQTIANTVSDSRFLEHVRIPNREQGFLHAVRNHFKECTMPPQPSPLVMRPAGLSIFGSSYGMLFSFTSEDPYRFILYFREQFYANAVLHSYDIRQTRPFIGHITLGYFGTDSTQEQKMQFANLIVSLNRSQEFQALPPFIMPRFVLNQYDELSCFNEYPQSPSFPISNPLNP